MFSSMKYIFPLLHCHFINAIRRVRPFPLSCMGVFVLLSTAAGQTFPSRTVPVACDRVWAAAGPIFLSRNLMPEASDRSGGFMKLRWSAGDDAGVRGANSDAKALTTYGGGKLFGRAYVERFRLVSGVFTVVGTDDSCDTAIKFEYQGWLHTFLNGTGWFDLPTNGAFENALLVLIGQKATAEPVQQTTIEPQGREQVPNRAASAGKTRTEVEKTQAIVVRLSSTPTDAEVEIDGEYWGSTPTGEVTRLGAGPHTIVVKKLGYLPWSRKFTLAPGDDRNVNAELQIEPNDGTKPRIVGN
jgi:hypothetical protein